MSETFDPWANAPEVPLCRVNPPFGERVASATEAAYTVVGRDPQLQGDDWVITSELYRLRGLIVGQSAEVESVLSDVYRQLCAEAPRPGGTAGFLLKQVRELLPAALQADHVSTLDLIKQAIDRRNRVVHDVISITYVERRYDGSMESELIPVMTMLGDLGCDEGDLRADLAQQQHALMAAVRLRQAVDTYLGGRYMEELLSRTGLPSIDDERELVGQSSFSSRRLGR